MNETTGANAADGSQIDKTQTDDIQVDEAQVNPAEGVWRPDRQPGERPERVQRDNGPHDSRQPDGKHDERQAAGPDSVFNGNAGQSDGRNAGGRQVPLYATPAGGYGQYGQYGQYGPGVPQPQERPVIAARTDPSVVTIVLGVVLLLVGIAIAVLCLLFPVAAIGNMRVVVSVGLVVVGVVLLVAALTCAVVGGVRKTSARHRNGKTGAPQTRSEAEQPEEGQQHQ